MSRDGLQAPLTFSPSRLLSPHFLGVFWLRIQGARTREGPGRDPGGTQARPALRPARHVSSRPRHRGRPLAGSAGAGCSFSAAAGPGCHGDRRQPQQGRPQRQRRGGSAGRSVWVSAAGAGAARPQHGGRLLQL